MSSNTSTGVFPPSSTVDFANRRAVATEMMRPTSVPPVNTTLSTKRCSARPAPATGPRPGITFSTPGGIPASRARSPTSSAVSGVCSEGLSTTLFPVANAGATLFDAIISGWLNDDNVATTPSGKREV